MQARRTLESMGRSLIDGWRNGIAYVTADPLVTTATIWLLLLGMAAVAISWLAPYSPTAVDLAAQHLPPGGSTSAGNAHLLGTDFLGRDVLTRLVYASRVSLAVSLGTVAVSGTFGILVGLSSGLIRGRFDSLMMRLADVQLGFPPLLIALIALYVLGGSVITLIITLSTIRWAMFARASRGIALSLTAKEFIEAAQAYGASRRRLVLRHLLPNAAGPLSSIASLEVARVILMEASLSFLGLGVQPPDTSWGAMIADEREFLASAWWVGVFPGLAIVLTAFSINVVSSYGGRRSQSR